MRLPFVSVQGSGETDENVVFRPQDPLRIPAGFDRTCQKARWNTQGMWDQLSDGTSPWFEADNESYIYWNRGNKKWWIDGPSGAGLYTNDAYTELPPPSGWVALAGAKEPLPNVVILENNDA
eukprot:CAMPEP_0196815694 /NCGR_PEP_ID=MMETSP1362-20130617/51281_1 /TAXON_ID=163516 /ORGANISM="Leptocylindrus danicus, Strain CCMP1856" /LENGTH=121 /DNA_ID=CAMNT_0042192743 /DNA_START=170 /DNA_END=535 /DNA_ORIENTATION=+